MLNKLILDPGAEPILPTRCTASTTAWHPRRCGCGRARQLSTASGGPCQQPGDLACALGAGGITGYVTLNYDKAWFAKAGLALPQSLERP